MPQLDFPNARTTTTFRKPSMGGVPDADIYTVTEAPSSEYRTVKAIARKTATDMAVSTFRCGPEKCLLFRESVWWHSPTDESLGEFAERLAEDHHSFKVKTAKGYCERHAAQTN